MAQIADIIKYEGDNKTLVWKHPLEDFNSMTQLIVHESQEAIFFMDGRALDLKQKGQYTLETKNLPEVGKILNWTTGNQTPFHCEVYFINKTEQMAIKWGTGSKIRYRDPEYNIPFSIGARGEMSLRVEDSRKLLIKLVGTESILSQSRLMDYFKGILMIRVKSYLAKTMQGGSISIFEVDSRLDELSAELKDLLKPDFAEYGMALERFCVTAIEEPKNDPNYESIKEVLAAETIGVSKTLVDIKIDTLIAQKDADIHAIEAGGTRAANDALGITESQKMNNQVLQTWAGNEGAGSTVGNIATGGFVGLGMGPYMGRAMVDIAEEQLFGTRESSGRTPKGFEKQDEVVPKEIKPKKEGNGSKETRGIKERLDDLKYMKDMGFLSEDEFETKRLEIINSI